MGKTSINGGTEPLTTQYPIYLPVILKPQNAILNGVNGATYDNIQKLWYIDNNFNMYTINPSPAASIGQKWIFKKIKLPGWKDTSLTQLTNNYTMRMVFSRETNRGIATIRVIDESTNATTTVAVIDQSGSFSRCWVGFDFSLSTLNSTSAVNVASPAVNPATAAPLPFDERTYTIEIEITGKNVASNNTGFIWERLSITRYTNILNKQYR